MRIKFALAASLFAVSLAGAAFAQPTYSDDYTNDSDGFAPSPVSKPAPVHYSSRKAPAYSATTPMTATVSPRAPWRPLPSTKPQRRASPPCLRATA